MNENENMELIEVTEEPEMVEEERSGLGFGGGLVFGGLLTLAGIAIGKKAKKVWDDYKTKRSKSEPIDAEVIEITGQNSETDPEEEEK